MPLTPVVPTTSSMSFCTYPEGPPWPIARVYTPPGRQQPLGAGPKDRFVCLHWLLLPRRVAARASSFFFVSPCALPPSGFFCVCSPSFTPLHLPGSLSSPCALRWPLLCLLSSPLAPSVLLSPVWVVVVFLAGFGPPVFLLGGRLAFFFTLLPAYTHNTTAPLRLLLLSCLCSSGPLAPVGQFPRRSPAMLGGRPSLAASPLRTPPCPARRRALLALPPPCCSSVIWRWRSTKVVTMAQQGRSTPPPPPCPSTALVQAQLHGETVIFGTINFAVPNGGFQFVLCSVVPV